MKRTRRKLGYTLLIFITVVAQFGFAGTGRHVAEAADKALAQKPYMGWSSYSMQVYDGPQGNWISEQKLKAMSDAMHEKLQSHGYEYINIDAGWNGSMDEYARPIPSTTLYPNGFENLIDYIHNNGQKVGIYLIPGMSKEAYAKNLPIYGTKYHMQDIAYLPLQKADYWDIGYKIDFSKPGAQEYVDSIADLIASWGVDFVKFDSVTPGSGYNNTSIDARGDVAAWSKALARHGIWFELSWALDHNYVDYWKQYANGWRIQWDVEAYNPEVGLTQWANIARLFPDAALWWRDAGPGGWNDFDSLNVGNGAMDGLTKDERQTAMTLWAISAAQLYVGNDLTRLDDYGLKLLTNDEVIAVNQAGRPAHPVSTETQQQVWYANNGDGTYNVALFNLGSRSAEAKVNWSDIGLDGPASVRDLWSHTELGTFNDSFSGGILEPHASRMLKVTAKGGVSAVNNDDTGMRYTGAWSRGGGKEQTEAKQDLGVTITDTSAQVPTEPEQPGNGNGGTTVTRSVYVNDTDSRIQYYGSSWNSQSGRPTGDYKNDVHYAEQDGDYFKYTFNGTGIDLLTEKDSSQGDIEVYLDDAVTPVTVNTHTSGEREVQQAVFSVSGLPDGEHTLKAVKASGSYMLLDALKVTADKLIVPAGSSFDKEISRQADLQAELVLGGGSFLGLRNGDTPLVQGTDYELSGSNVKVLKNYLLKQPFGETTLVFDFEGGGGELWPIEIKTSATASSSITPGAGSFDKAASLQQDIAIAVDLNGNTLTAIEHNGSPLSEGDDYTFEDGTVILKKAYLAAQPVGQTALTFVFSAGDPQILTLQITNTNTVRYIVLNNDDSSIKYTGSWSRNSGRTFGDYMDDVHFTEQNGDFFEYTFRGTGIQMYTELDNSMGDVDIYVDGHFEQTVNTYSSSRKVQQNVFSVSGLPEGLHTLKAVKKNGTYMLLDMLKVEVPDLINPVAASFDKNASLQEDVEVLLLQEPGMFKGISSGGTPLLAGTDYTLSGNKVTLSKTYLAGQPTGTLKLSFLFGGDYQNDVQWTADNGDFVQYTFKGTGVQLIGPKGPALGEMEVYIDGTLKATVDANHAGRQILQNLYSISGLADGLHTIKVAKKSGELLLIDQLKYTVGASGSSPGTPDPGTSNPGGPAATPAPSATPTPTATLAPGGNPPSVTPAASPYLKGYADGQFKPDRNITRAEIASILANAFAGKEGGNETSFGDVSSGSWAAEAIAKVTKLGLMQGYPDGSFQPDRPLTRAELASLIVSLLPEASGQGQGFTDITGSWAKAAILKAQAAGILKGYPDGTFRPDQPLTRAETVVAMNRVLGIAKAGGAAAVFSDVPATHWAYAEIQAATAP
ncbi:X2-like carbohydrate binding domain-containing protein [Paenibacillus sp. NFR01]|uniref:X2-like carbohydrate binding domain-containing protein n=1 Tax=Paenibacillus sp. NFR01 TaxID=1566279 RepID=UPI0008BB8378|nr:X2-like carbohydrate binding domain-containing protein [Paenibacillus sp. NFR01]SET68337.1 S-layer homology domain-containing protein [Paenibacillus sp. NFR01]